MRRTTAFIGDAYADKPRTERDKLVERLREAKARYWGDPGDRDLREAMEAAADVLAAYDKRRGGA